MSQWQDDRCIAVINDEAGVREAHAKLDHLACGDPLLPRAGVPEKSEGVVSVHDHVNETVHGGTEIAITSSFHFADQEPGPDQQDMVVAVQEGDLVVLLAQDHPESVQQLNILIVVVNPDEIRNSKGRSTADRHITPDSSKNWVRVDFVAHSNNAPDIQNTLIQVVREDIGLDLEFLSIFHPSCSKIHNTQIEN